MARLMCTVPYPDWQRQVQPADSLSRAMIGNRLSLIHGNLPFRNHVYRPPLHLSFRPEAEGRSGEIWRRIRYASPMQADVSTTLDMTRDYA